MALPQTSRGRACLVDLERSEQIYLATGDQVQSWTQRYIVKHTRYSGVFYYIKSKFLCFWASVSGGVMFPAHTKSWKQASRVRNEYVQLRKRLPGSLRGTKQTGDNLYCSCKESNLTVTNSLTLISAAGHASSVFCARKGAENMTPAVRSPRKTLKCLSLESLKKNGTPEACSFFYE